MNIFTELKLNSIRLTIRFHWIAVKRLCGAKTVHVWSSVFLSMVQSSGFSARTSIDQRDEMVFVHGEKEWTHERIYYRDSRLRSAFWPRYSYYIVRRTNRAMQGLQVVQPGQQRPWLSQRLVVPQMEHWHG